MGNSICKIVRWTITKITINEVFENAGNESLKIIFKLETILGELNDRYINF